MAKKSEIAEEFEQTWIDGNDITLGLREKVVTVYSKPGWFAKYGIGKRLKEERVLQLWDGYSWRDVPKHYETLTV